MNRLIRYLLCALFCIVVQQTARAQQYPVTASTQVIPPYSVYLPDYAVPGSDKLRVILVQNDLTQPSYDVRLQMTVEQNGTVIMRTAGFFNPKPLTLSPGVPTIIGGYDLVDYLNSANIEFSGGFSKDEYERTKSLPEGAYRISFTAFDYRRPKVQVSNTGANIFFFRKSEPPLLNLPVCGSRVEKHDPQFLSFNWTNRNSPSPLPGSGTEYIFSLYEIKPKGSNPDYILRSARPIYTVTTESNTLVYGPGEPLLIDSMQYVWTVQARDKSGRDMFSNQGLSRSCTFTYLGNNPFAQNTIPQPKLSGISLGTRSIRLSWPLAPANATYTVETYRLQYRATKTGDTEFDWTTVEKQRDTALTVNSLDVKRSYEARLQWKVAGIYGPFSPTVTVTTDSAKPVVCGEGNNVPQSSNTVPLPTAIAGTIVRIGHFEVMLTKVTGGDGKFSGTGKVISSGFGSNLQMIFKDITINADMYVTQGKMEAITDGIDKFVKDALDEQHGGNNVGQVVTGNVVPDIVTTLHIFDIRDIKVNLENGTITITDSQTGATETINYAAQGKTLPLVIEDAGGNLYKVDKDGKVTAIGRRDPSISNSTGALNTLQLDKGKVIFSAVANSTYAFDAWKDSYAGKPVLEESYESLANGQYRVSSKALVPDAQENVTATLQNAATGVDATKLKFVSGAGIVYPAVKNGNTFTITLTGGPAGDAQELFAVYQPDSATVISMGKLLVASYAPLQKKVVLIPVGTNTDAREAAIKAALNSAYSKVGVSYEVTVDNSFREDKSWDKSGDGVLQDTKSAFLSNGFTGEEKAMKKAYTSKHSADDNTVYFFMINEAALQDGDLAGKMPRQSQYGFIFMKDVAAEVIARTVAHEVGHGDFTLEHTFSVNTGLQKSTTTNLMDYGTGYDLLKYQWNVIHDPGHVWGLFEDDAASDNKAVTSIDPMFINKDGKTVSFLTMGGNIISLPHAKLRSVSFQYGAVIDANNKEKFDPELAPGTISGFWLGDNSNDAVNYVYKGNGNFVNAAGESYRQTVDVNLVDGFVYPVPCGRSYDLYKFPVTDKFLHYAGDEQMLTLKDLADKFTPFADDAKPLPELHFKQNINLYTAAVCNYCTTGLTATMTLRYCEQPEVMWVDKIGQMRAVYPEYFKQFTVDDRDGESRDRETPEQWEMPHFVRGDGMLLNLTKGWGKYLSENENVAAAYESNRVAFLRTFYSVFKDYIKTASSSGDQFWNNFNEQTSYLDLLTQLTRESVFHLKGIAPEKKYLAMRKLLDKSVITAPLDEQFVFVLGSFNESDYPGLLTYIEDSLTIGRIYAGLYNHNSITSSGLKCLNTGIMLINKMIIATEHEVIDVAKEREMADKPYLLPKLEADIFRLSNMNYRFAEKNYLNIDGYGMVHYNQRISLEVAGSFSVMGKPYKKGAIVHMPAIQAVLLSHVNTMDVAEKTAWAAVDIGTMVIGIGEAKVLLSSANYIRKLVVLTDMVGSVGGIVLQTINNDAISDTMRGRLQMWSSILSLPNMLMAIPKVERAVDDLDDVINARIGAKGTEITADEVDELVEISDDLSKRAGLPTIADDATRIADRAVSIDGAGDVTDVKRWLDKSRDPLDNNIYIVVHSDGVNFNVIHNGQEVTLSHRSLASWIRSKNIPETRNLVLLSCNNIESAKNLGKNLKRDILVNDGAVTVFENGAIEVENGLKRVDKAGNVTDASDVKIGKQAVGEGDAVRLGKKLENMTDAELVLHVSNRFGVSGDVATRLLKNEAFMKAFSKTPQTRLIQVLQSGLPATEAVTVGGKQFKNIRDALVTQMADDAALFKGIDDRITAAQDIFAKGNLTDLDYQNLGNIESEISDMLAARDFDRAFFSAGIFNTAIYKTWGLTAQDLAKLKKVRKDMGIPEGSNLIVANIEHSGGIDEVVAHSGYANQATGTSPKPESYRLGQFAQGSKKINRFADSESKLFEELLDDIDNGKYAGVTRIKIISERPVCPSCANVMRNFKAEALRKHGINIEIVTFEGKMPL